MSLYENSGVNDQMLKEFSVSVSKPLKGRCRFCGRGFETGERIVFGTVKNVQMKFMEADVEAGEPAGFGEQHILEMINAHLPCAKDNSNKFRSVINPRK